MHGCFWEPATKKKKRKNFLLYISGWAVFTESTCGLKDLVSLCSRGSFIQLQFIPQKELIILVGISPIMKGKSLVLCTVWGNSLRNRLKRQRFSRCVCTCGKHKDKKRERANKRLKAARTMQKTAWWGHSLKSWYCFSLPLSPQKDATDVSPPPKETQQANEGATECFISVLTGNKPHQASWWYLCLKKHYLSNKQCCHQPQMNYVLLTFCGPSS